MTQSISMEEYSRITPQIEDLTERWSKNCHIDRALYQKYDVKRGLRDANGRGVLASLTRISEVKGVYVPFWLYDGRMEARGAYKAEISESHREGDYIVTTTRHFDVARVGDADFVRVPVDGSSKMPDAHMDAIEPFDYSDLKPFSTAYLPGFLADRYDEDDKKCAARVLTRMKNSTAAALHDTLGGYTGVQTLSEQLDPRTLEPHYALLPVWMLHTRWKDKDFLFAMNGQTGRLIGDLPVDKSRVAAWFAGISLPLMAVLAFLLLL